MADRTTVIESEQTAPAPAPSDRVIDLATEVGAMRVESQSTRGEIAELRSGQNQLLDLVRNQNEIIGELRNQTASAQRQAEAAQVTAAVAVETATEEEEETNDFLSVNPEVETRVEITQTPVKQRKWIHNLIYGR